MGKETGASEQAAMDRTKVDCRPAQLLQDCEHNPDSDLFTEKKIPTHTHPPLPTSAHMTASRAATFLVALLFLPSTASAMIVPNAPTRHSNRPQALQAATSAAASAARPGSDTTRAGFVAALIRSLHPNAITPDCLTPLATGNVFPDVPADAPFAPALCAAKRLGIIRGYPDGLFRPDRIINAAESAKVIAISYGLVKESTDPAIPWYQPSVDALARLDIRFGTPTLDAMIDPPRAMRVLWAVHCSDYWLTQPCRMSQGQNGSGRVVYRPCSPISS